MIDPAVLERVHHARAREIPASDAPFDEAALLAGAVQAWLADVEDALARLLVGGLAHPDGELPAALGLLAERAGRLGAQTAARGLAALQAWTEALRPGPPDLASRNELAQGAWDEAMQLVAWLRLFRADLGLTTAAAAARGLTEGPADDETPRFTGRIWVDGLTLSAENRLVIVARTADGEPVLAFDPLGDVDREDPFAKPVISRLLQDVVDLGRVARSAMDLDRHPYVRRGDTIMVQPAFRAVPRVLDATGPGPSSRASVRTLVDVRFAEGAVTVREANGRPVQVGRTLRFNLCKRLAIDGVSTRAIEVTGLPRQDGLVVIAADDGSGPAFPAIDARAWVFDPSVLAALTEGSDPWLRAAAGLFGGLSGPAVGALDETLRAFVGDASLHWRLTWWAARVGLDGPTWRTPETWPADPGASFAAVWALLWEGGRDAELEAIWPRYADLPEPSLPDVCARALLLDQRGDREAAVAYLEAHVVQVARTARTAETLPSAGDLLALADTRSWLVGGDRSGRVADALGLPAVPLRERAANALLRWRVWDGPERAEGTGPVGLADELALAAVSGWGPTLVG